MSISLEKRRAYSEVLEYIYLLDKEYINRIPLKFMQFLEKNRDCTYIKNINPWEPIEKQNLKEDAIILLAYINMRYWSSAKEQEILKNIYVENEIKYQEECRKKYNPDDIFKKEKNIKKQEVLEKTSLNMGMEVNAKKNFAITSKIKKLIHYLKRKK